MNATATPQTDTQNRPAWSWAGLLFVAAIILVYVVLVGGPGRRAPGTEGPEIGRTLTYLRLEPLTGMAHDTTLTDVSGSVTLLNFWGTWCPPCVREFPELVELQTRYRGQRDFRMLAVSCGQGGDDTLDALRDSTTEFLNAGGYSLDTYADRNASTRRAMTILFGWEGFAYPTTVVLDKNSIIRGLWQGYDPRAKAEMTSLIEVLLKE